ncbi:hypothetical protein QE152_g7984 [Popillia japonica]|uniref:Uncharacterized protein n=1 Tax=Popillia japonica TaxID=7064 RepID=A0AAW1MCX6_POPJA
MPPDTSSKLQLMDQGVIHSLKRFLKQNDEFYDDDDDLPLSEWLKKTTEVEISQDDAGVVPLTEQVDVNFEEYVCVDSNVLCREDLSDSCIIDSISTDVVEDDCEDEDSANDDISSP